MAKRNFQIKLKAYTDAAQSNNPKEVLFDNTEIFTDDLGEEQSSRVEDVPAASSDYSIDLGSSSIRVLFIKNLSDEVVMEFKLNGTGNTAYKIAPGKVFFLESANVNDVGQITSLHVNNPDVDNSVKLKIFASS